MAVAIVTDSASDLSPERAAAAGVTVVPLLIRFGDTELRAGVDLSLPAFYERLLAPGAPFPTTAACSPGDFAQAFEGRLRDGADGVVCITVGSRLSATHRAATVGRDTLGDPRVHVVDSDTVTMVQGLLVLLAAEAAAAGATATQVVASVEARRGDGRMFVMLDTLEYLRRGGRIGTAQAAIGSMLSIKPIITIAEGVVETLDKPRTLGRARARVLELLGERPVERLAVVHSQAPGIAAFADEAAQVARVDRAGVITELIGPSVAPHAGPGAFGVAVLLRGPQG